MTKMLVIIIYWTDSMITHREEGEESSFPEQFKGGDVVEYCNGQWIILY